jgi:hypothetical protein
VTEFVILLLKTHIAVMTIAAALLVPIPVNAMAMLIVFVLILGFLEAIVWGAMVIARDVPAIKNIAIIVVIGWLIRTGLASVIK